MLLRPVSVFNESELRRLSEDLFCFMNFDMMLSSKLLDNLFKPDNFGDLHGSCAFSRILQVRGSSVWAEVTFASLT